jgi:hypothetical protein
MGFDSEEGFTKMDKDYDMANGIQVEMMELKPVVVKKTMEKRTRGEGQTPFGKMVKCDDFVYIFHGERFTKGEAPVDKILVLEQSLGNKLIEVVKGAVTVYPLPRRRQHFFLLPILLRSLGRHFQVHSLRVARGLRGKGQGDLGGLGFFKREKAGCGSIWGILEALGGLQIQSTVFTQRYRGLNNQRLGTVYCFEVEELFQGIIGS